MPSGYTSIYVLIHMAWPISRSLNPPLQLHVTSLCFPLDTMRERGEMLYIVNILSQFPVFLQSIVKYNFAQSRVSKVLFKQAMACPAVSSSIRHVGASGFWTGFSLSIGSRGTPYCVDAAAGQSVFDLHPIQWWEKQDIMF